MTKVLQSLEQKERLILSIIFVIIFALLVFDVYEDLVSGASFAHVGFEAFILLLVILGVVVQWSVYFSQRRNIEGLNYDLGRARVDLDKYKENTKKFVEGLSEQIDSQLSRWELTKAEKDITFLILKGLSNKEIGEVRSTSEKTVRQQVSSIFQKSNLKSRLELSAYFLEDLLVVSHS
jgi:DNA-binding CsgD family transcriptional regulator